MAKEMEAQRKALRLALLAKAEAFASSAPEPPYEPPLPEATPSVLSEAVRAMRLWVSKPEDVPEEERDALTLTLAR